MRTRKAWTKPAEKPSELLERAYNLLKEPKRWCKRAYGKYKDGFAPIIMDPNRLAGDTAFESFCSLGAIYRTMDGTHFQVRLDAEKFLYQAIDQEGEKFGSIPTFNDYPDTKKRDVLKVFKHAIKLAKEVENG